MCDEGNVSYWSRWVSQLCCCFQHHWPSDVILQNLPSPPSTGWCSHILTKVCTQWGHGTRDLMQNCYFICAKRRTIYPEWDSEVPGREPAGSSHSRHPLSWVDPVRIVVHDDLLSYRSLLQGSHGGGKYVSADAGIHAGGGGGDIPLLGVSPPPDSLWF